MVTMTLTRLVGGGELRLPRAAAVTERNLVAFGHGTYWWVVVSGLVEPLLYLFTIGWGVGALIGVMTLPDGTTVSYLSFVAPAMVAVAAMNGAIAETTMNLFAKMKYAKLYESVLNTPVTPMEIALGELGWALARGGMYTVVFLLAMVWMGLTTPLLALVALPAALLVGLAFGSLGIAAATVMRTWQDFDYIGAVQFALFLFSGTFVPVATFPAALQVLVQITPLYHGVTLLRGIGLGMFEWGMIWQVAYLLAAVAVGMAVAARRMSRMLRK